MIMMAILRAMAKMAMKTIVFENVRFDLKVSLFAMYNSRFNDFVKLISG